MSLNSLIKKATSKQQPTKQPRKKASAQPEAIEQAKVIAWARANEGSYTGLWMLHSSLNGVRLSKAQAGKAKAGGMLAGVPDLFLPVRSYEYCGLYIEMKSEKGRVSKEQSRFLSMVSTLGYAVYVCYSAQEAIDKIKDYYSPNNA